MQSLCNVIKSSSVVKEGKKFIVTEFSLPVIEEKERETSLQEDTNLESSQEEIERDRYKKLAQTMFENYRKKGEEVVRKAKQEAEDMKKEAYETSYEKGYSEGQQKGYDDAYDKAYKEAYETNLKKAYEESENIIQNAQHISDNLISSAKEEYTKYIDDKKDEIKYMIENIVEHVFKKEIEDKTVLNNMILDVVNHAKNSKNIVVKCRKENREEIENTIEEWKQTNVFKGDIFIIEDDSLSEGISIVEKDNGKTEIDITKALQKVKEILTCSD